MSPLEPSSHWVMKRFGRGLLRNRRRLGDSSLLHPTWQLTLYNFCFHKDKTRKWILFMSYWYGLMKENWNENTCASGHTWRSAHGPRRSFSSCSGQPPVAKHRGLAPRGVSTGPNHHHLRIRLLKVGCFLGLENEDDKQKKDRKLFSACVFIFCQIAQKVRYSWTTRSLIS